MDIKRHLGECEAAQSVSHYEGEEVCVFGLNWGARLLTFFKVRVPLMHESRRPKYISRLVIALTRPSYVCYVVTLISALHLTIEWVYCGRTYASHEVVGDRNRCSKKFLENFLNSA